jgi:hypothetical protein
MFNLFQKPVFKFYSRIPGVLDSFPIVPSKTIRPSWVRSVVDAYKKQTEDVSNYGNRQLTSIAKCPGIIDLAKQGWIVRSWFDFIIRTDGPSNIAWKVPPTFPPSVLVDDFTTDPIRFMSLTDPELKIPLPPQTCHAIVKIATPWIVDIPKGWNLLMLPISYPDDTRFQCSTGILRPGLHVEVQPQVFWNVTQGEELVKAGTPLCQLIPIPETIEEAQFECLGYTEEMKARQKDFYYKKGFSFIRSQNV